MEIRSYCNPERHSPVNTVPVLIGLIQVSLVLLLGHLLFQVPLRGQLLDVYWVSLLFIVANLSMGLVVFGLFILVAMTIAVKRFRKRLD